MNGPVLCGLIVGVGLALILSSLSLGLCLRADSRADTTARRIAKDVSRREINGYWHALERQMLELQGRVDALQGIRPTLSLVRSDASDGVA